MTAFMQATGLNFHSVDDSDDVYMWLYTDETDRATIRVRIPYTMLDTAIGNLETELAIESRLLDSHKYDDPDGNDQPLTPDEIAHEALYDHHGSE